MAYRERAVLWHQLKQCDGAVYRKDDHFHSPFPIPIQEIRQKFRNIDTSKLVTHAHLYTCSLAHGVTDHGELGR